MTLLERLASLNLAGFFGISAPVYYNVGANAATSEAAQAPTIATGAIRTVTGSIRLA